MSINAKIIEHMSRFNEEDGEAYQNFFKSALSKFGVKSPADLDNDKKKEFYDYIDNNYKAKNEAMLKENPAVIATAARIAVQNAQGKKVSVNTARQKSYAKKDPSAHNKAKGIFQRIKDKFKKKDEPKKKEAPKSQEKSAAQKYSDLYGGGAKVESTKAYGDTLKKIAKDRQLKGISKSDRDKLIKIAQMMKNANENINEDLHPYKDFGTDNSWERNYDLNLGAFVEHYQDLVKFMKKHKVVPDKNKRAWANAIREKIGRPMLNGHMSQMRNIMDLLKMGEKFRNLKDKDGWVMGESINEAPKPEEPSQAKLAIKGFLDAALKKAGIKIIKHQEMKRGFTKAIYGCFYWVKSAEGKAVLPFYVWKDGKIELGVSAKGFLVGKYGQMSTVVKNLKDFKKKDLDIKLGEVASPLVNTLHHAINDVEKLMDVVNSNQAGDAFKKVRASKNALKASHKLLKKVK
tara:strand:+ start:2133 stop:3512 length:1380 start_codon:yes stop_codon:yes gene_type:complete